MSGLTQCGATPALPVQAPGAKSRLQDGSSIHPCPSHSFLPDLAAGKSRQQRYIPASNPTFILGPSNTYCLGGLIFFLFPHLPKGLFLYRGRESTRLAPHLHHIIFPQPPAGFPRAAPPRITRSLENLFVSPCLLL